MFCRMTVKLVNKKHKMIMSFILCTQIRLKLQGKNDFAGFVRLIIRKLDVKSETG